VSNAVWKALADPTRREILDQLATGEASTGSLCAHFASEERGGLARTTVMKHLDVLVNCQLVLIRRQGRQRFNFLNPAPLQSILDRWLSRHTQQVARSLQQLQNHSESTQDDGN